MSAANISRMLNGKQNLTLDNIHALADALQERIILSFECDWQADFKAVADNLFVRSEEKWCRSDRFDSPNLQYYKSINIEAANEDLPQDFEWAGFCESSFLEQRA